MSKRYFRLLRCEDGCDVQINPRIRVGYFHPGSCWDFWFSRNDVGQAVFYQFWIFYLAVRK